jgi:uncharacterized membrane protein YbhN (UPF0104 family)
MDGRTRDPEGPADHPPEGVAPRPGLLRGRRYRRRHQDEAGVPDEEGLPQDRPHGVGRKIVSGLLSYGVVLAIFLFLIPKLMGGQSAAGAIESIKPVTWVFAVLLGVANLASNWPPICVGLPGLRLREAGVSNTASAALSNTVPEGGAVATGLTFAMQRSWGFRLEAITLGFTATGLWTNLVRYGLLAVGLVVWAAEDRSVRLALFAAGVTVLMAAVLVVLGLILRRERFARAFGRLAGRIMHPYFRLTHREEPDFADEVAAFRHDLIGLLRTRWLPLTVSMAVSQVMAALVLLVMLRLQGVGADVVGPAQVYVAYASSALVSLVIPVPGGIGVVEATLLAILGVNQTAAVQDQILSAILAYRAATWLLPIPIGAGSYLFWRYNKGWRHTQEEKEALLPITAALAP